MGMDNMEIKAGDYDYCAWAQKRLIDSESDKSIQGYSDGIFWERNSKPKNQ